MTTPLPRKRPTPHFEETQGPIVIGGVGGSGTRAVIEVLRRLGIYTGSELNQAGDNEWFTLLCKLPRWKDDETDSIMRSFDLLERAMQGMLRSDPQRTERRSPKLSTVARLGSSRGDLLDSMSEAWLRTVSSSLLRSRHMVPEGAPKWGWKEPNSHIFLARAADVFRRSPPLRARDPQRLLHGLQRESVPGATVGPPIRHRDRSRLTSRVTRLLDPVERTGDRSGPEDAARVFLRRQPPSSLRIAAGRGDEVCRFPGDPAIRPGARGAHRVAAIRPRQWGSPGRGWSRNSERSAWLGFRLSASRSTTDRLVLRSCGLSRLELGERNPGQNRSARRSRRNAGSPCECRH